MSKHFISDALDYVSHFVFFSVPMVPCTWKYFYCLVISYMSAMDLGYIHLNPSYYSFNPFNTSNFMSFYFFKKKIIY